MKQSINQMPSPCVRNCCLDMDDICMGCHRSLSEITEWLSANEDRRNEILLNCEERKQLKRR